MANPRPDPEVSFTRFLVKKGSNTRPTPVRLDAAAVVGDGERRVAAGRNDLVARLRFQEVDLAALDDDLARDDLAGDNIAVGGDCFVDGLDRVANQVVDRPRQLRLRSSDAPAGSR